jgi:hypothetical protein
MGTRTFDGGRIQCDGGPNVVGRTCSGFQQSPFNQAATGRLQSCGRAAVDTVWEEVDGVLESCAEVGLPSGMMLCPAGTPQRERVSQACFEALSQYTSGGACRQFGADSATTGTLLGQQIEAQFSQPPNQLTQLSVPGASKSAKCDAGNPGYPDIVRVVRRTPTSVTVQLGDVKPLSRSGLAKGLNDVYSCYQDAFDRAAAKCAPDAGRTPADTTFCNQLGALNRTVTVDRTGNLGFTPGQFCGQAADGGPLKVEAMECQPGVTAYRCFP